jgi:hypothetical protein
MEQIKLGRFGTALTKQLATCLIGETELAYALALIDVYFLLGKGRPAFRKRMYWPINTCKFLATGMPHTHSFFGELQPQFNSVKRYSVFQCFKEAETILVKVSGNSAVGLTVREEERFHVLMSTADYRYIICRCRSVIRLSCAISSITIHRLPTIQSSPFNFTTQEKDLY